MLSVIHSISKNFNICIILMDPENHKWKLSKMNLTVCVWKGKLSILHNSLRKWFKKKKTTDFRICKFYSEKCIGKAKSFMGFFYCHGLIVLSYTPQGKGKTKVHKLYYNEGYFLINFLKNRLNMKVHKSWNDGDLTKYQKKRFRKWASQHFLKHVHCLTSNRSQSRFN